MNKEIISKSSQDVSIPSSGLRYTNNKLYLAGLCLADITKSLPSPAYLYSLEKVRNNYQHFEEAAKKHFKNFTICYAMKANSHAKILKTLSSLGSGADIVSVGEFKLAIASGIRPEKIVFSGVGKTRSEIEYVLNHSPNGIKSFNVESLDEYELLIELSNKYQRSLPVTFRLNPDVNANTHEHIATGGYSTKFGMTNDQIEVALLEKAPFINMMGFSIHIGSQLKNFSETRSAINQIISLIKRSEIKLKFIDVGGGLGIPYGPHDVDLTSTEEYFSLVKDVLKNYYHEDDLPEIVFEPGRCITGNAGVLLSRVIRLKETGTKSFIILDAGMNDLIRPSLYSAYHEILPIERYEAEKSQLYDFVGPICETGDFFAKDRESTKINKGDLVAIGNCGSYARSMASNYNSREFAPEYFLEDLS